VADREYSSFQKKVISRYYDNREQIDAQKLSELVTNLYLADEKKRDKMWARAEDLMTRLKVPASRVKHIIEKADPAILAEVVKDIESGKIK